MSTKDPKTGKTKFEKEGLGPVQREGIEYEPDIFGWMADATLTFDKTRCDRIEPQSAWPRPGDDVAALLAEWIQDTGTPQLHVPGADAKDPNDRGAAYEAAIFAATDPAMLDFIAAKIAGEKIAPLKADVIGWVAARRAALAAEVPPS